MKQQRKEHQILWILLPLLCLTFLATVAVAATRFYRSASDTDLVIDLIPENGVYAQRLVGAGSTSSGSALLDDLLGRKPQTKELYEIIDQDETVWYTDTRVEIFKTTYENDQQKTTVAGSNKERVIAPGTENTYIFALRNNAAGEIDYRLTGEAFFTGLEEGQVIPVEVRLSGANGWVLGDEDTWVPVSEMNNMADYGTVVKYGHNIYKFEWRWPFESGNDEWDTWLGNQTEDITLTARLITDSTYHHTEVPVLRGPVPGLLDGVHHMAYLYGYEDGTIRPNANITRAEVAAIFFRLLKTDIRRENATRECSYSDVPTDAWYRQQVATMTKLGILKGYPDGSFRPNEPITRAEMATILARLVDWEIEHSEETAFPDIDNHWAEDNIRLIEQLNWIIGYEDSTFRPDAFITRAEAVTMINRMLHRVPERHEDVHEDAYTWPDNSDPNAWYYLAIQEATHTHTYWRIRGSRESWVRIVEMPEDVSK